MFWRPKTETAYTIHVSSRKSDVSFLSFSFDGPSNREQEEKKKRVVYVQVDVRVHKALCII